MIHTLLLILMVTDLGSTNEMALGGIEFPTMTENGTGQSGIGAGVRRAVEVVVLGWTMVRFPPLRDINMSRTLPKLHRTTQKASVALAI